jgi:hypothetical protein
MAINKKGFILYADQKALFDQLTNDKAGELIKFIFSYVNDENPTTNDLIINLAFTPIKQQLKRDLVKFMEIKEIRRKAGKIGMEKRWQSITNDNKPLQPITNITVNDNDNDNVNDNVNDKKDIVSRKLKFSDSLKTFINVYPRETLNDFYNYWSEPNKSNTKFRQELEKTWDTKRRLENWTRNDKNFKKETEIITFKKPFV